LGFNPAGVQVLNVDLSLLRYSEEEAVVFMDNLRERATVIPGVEAVGYSQTLPLGGTTMTTAVEVPGSDFGPGGEGLEADLAFVTPGFFRALGIGFLEGRSFQGTGSEGGQEVVVNRIAAARIWPGQGAVGKTLRVAGEARTVSGVVVDGKVRAIGEAPRFVVYLPLGPQASRDIFLVARARPSTTGIGRELRRVVAELDPRIPVQTNQPFEAVIGQSLLPNRVAAGLAGSLGLAGLLLTIIGLYGVLSHNVAHRTREIGVRMALGADARRIQGSVVGGGIRLVALGGGVGLPFAIAISWALRSRLYGLSPADPLILLATTVLLSAVAAFSSFLPARRATAVDPSIALREER
ncbi:MAG: ABC transporter permease, partial [Gemmatimonadota bacterium]